MAAYSPTIANTESLFKIVDTQIEMRDKNNYHQSNVALRHHGEVHGPFKTDIECAVLDPPFPNKVDE